MDSIDVRLCMFLMTNSRTPYHELAGMFGLSINAVHKRIKALIEMGIIRGFTARVSLSSLKVTTVWVYGRSSAEHPGEAHLGLKNNDSTYWVANSGGGYIYVGGYLRDLSELDSYVSFVKTEAGIDDPTVGILPQSSGPAPSPALHQLDYQILASLSRDSRKPLSEVAAEVKASTKTVHRRLEWMIEHRLVDLALDWYPDKSNDIVSLCHVKTSGANRGSVLSDLKTSFGQNVLFELMFSNLPNELTLFLWTNSMRQMDDLREGIAKAKGVGSVTLNILQIGYIFETWVDRLSLKESKRALPARS
jgi:DNA-binding Lrp family transcriptional regulator